MERVGVVFVIGVVVVVGVVVVAVGGGMDELDVQMVQYQLWN